MGYGIRWYKGVGEHDYKESGFTEYASGHELMLGLLAGATQFVSEDQLFEALRSGPQEVIYWVTDDFGFSFCQPS